MTKASLKIAILCVAWMMLPGAGWGQAQLPLESGTSGQSTGGRHLSATGRVSEAFVPASKLVGAEVDDRSGNRVGELQDVIVDPHTGRIDFGLVWLSSSPTNANETSPSPASSSVRSVPVPWSLLKVSSAAEHSTESGQLAFTLNADRNRLAKAPTVDWSDPYQNQSQWRQRIFAYYGITPPPAAAPQQSQTHP